MECEPNSTDQSVTRTRGARWRKVARDASAPRYVLILSVSMVLVGLLAAMLSNAMGSARSIDISTLPWIMYVVLLQISARWRAGDVLSESLCVTVAICLANVTGSLLRQALTPVGMSYWGPYIAALVLLTSFGVPVNAILIGLLRSVNRLLDRKLAKRAV